MGFLAYYTLPPILKLSGFSGRVIGDEEGEFRLLVAATAMLSVVEYGTMVVIVFRRKQNKNVVVVGRFCPTIS